MFERWSIGAPQYLTNSAGTLLLITSRQQHLETWRLCEQVRRHGCADASGAADDEAARSGSRGCDGEDREHHAAKGRKQRDGIWVHAAVV